MNTRDFLNITAALGISVALPAGLGDAGAVPLTDAPLDAQPPGVPGPFMVDHEYGREIPFYGVTELPQSVIDDSIALLAEDAKASLPPGTPFQIRRKLPENYGLSHGLAWYYAPYLRTSKPEKLGFIAAGGYYNHGRFIT